MRPRILLRLSLNLLGIGIFEESSQLRAEFREMIQQLRVGKIVRSRNVRVFIDRSDPGLENVLPLSDYKVAKTGGDCDRRPFLNVTSDERNPPNLISGTNA